jgi:hypothetical protein
VSESQRLRQVFVSHAHEDSAWCNTFVGTLRQAGTDVWYDEHNLGYGRLMDVIERELRQRPVFLVVLSPAAVASLWVRREVNAAIRLHDAEPDRIVLPIIAHQCEIPLLWGEYRWLSGSNDTGLAPLEAAREVLRTLGIGQGARMPGQSWDEASVFDSFARACTPHATSLTLPVRAEPLFLGARPSCPMSRHASISVQRRTRCSASTSGRRARWSSSSTSSICRAEPFHSLRWRAWRSGCAPSRRWPTAMRASNRLASRSALSCRWTRCFRSQVRLLRWRVR